MPNNDGQIHFTRVTRADLAVLHAWFARAHVAEWWGAPGSREEIEAEFDPEGVDDTMVQHFIASDAGGPIGFIQSYVAGNAGKGWWPDETDPGVRGIDQFLAEASELNRGLGTAMVRAFVAQLFGDSAVTRIQTDPRPTNARAIRCYEKAGFRRVGEVDTPDGIALLLVCDRAAWHRSLAPGNATV